MGRYSYPCAKCGQTITEKVNVSNTTEVAHKLCAVCEEEWRKAHSKDDEEKDDLQD
jgi:DNA-directed RNA polymerase subunit RPC12/RpoP